MNIPFVFLKICTFILVQNIEKHAYKFILEPYSKYIS